jgi:hypothetical protein
MAVRLNAHNVIMRVTVGFHGADVDRVIQTYNLMPERYFTHAPTLFMRAHHTCS